MGRSKFPGKPSKLVNKKRISVLKINNFTDNKQLIQFNDQITLWDNNKNETTTLFNHGDIQGNSGLSDVITEQSTVEKPSTSVKETTNEAALNLNDNTNEDICNKLSENKKNDTSIKMESNNNNNNSDGVTTRARTSNNNCVSISNCSPSVSDKNHKKKTVTFKNVLETSDDIQHIRKINKPINGPLIPIIKVRTFKPDCIVRPSRLTEVLKNNNNFIDKIAPQQKSSSTINDNTLEQHSDDLLTTSINKIFNNNFSIGDKRFILPKRSIHSCRVIKPNKKFLDDIGEGKLRVNRNKCLLSGSSISLTTTASQLKLNKKLLNELDGLKSISSHEDKHIDEDSFINGTLSSKIISSKLIEDKDGNKLSDENQFTDNSDDSQDDDEEDDQEKEEVENNDDKDEHLKDTEDDNSDKIFDYKKNKIETLNPFAVTGKIILRKPRLQFNSLSLSSTIPVSSSLPQSDNIFSMNLNSINSTTCGICGSISILRHNKKFGINSCELCRKFISKMIKKLAASSSNCINYRTNTLQCTKGNGTCLIQPISKNNITKSLRFIVKERCSACWLRKCLKIYQIPVSLRTRLVATLPTNMKDIDNKITSAKIATTLTSTLTTTGTTIVPSISSSPTSVSPSTKISSPSSLFNNRRESNMNETGSTNLFSSMAGKFMLWSSSSDADHNKITPVVSFSNPLVENNATFGSLPSIKPNIFENPVIMVSKKNNMDVTKKDEKVSSSTNVPVSMPETAIPTKSPLSTTSAESNSLERNFSANSVNCSTKQEVPIDNEKVNVNADDNLKNKLRKKEKNAFPQPTIIDPPKRQRIDFKGPRVKHVCRSASIVLGQPIATFSTQESRLLETMDTPPRPDSPLNGELDDTKNLITLENNDRIKVNVTTNNDESTDQSCNDCTKKLVTDNKTSSSNTPDDHLGLSPPATPIEQEQDDEFSIGLFNCNRTTDTVEEAKNISNCSNIKMDNIKLVINSGKDSVINQKIKNSDNLVMETDTVLTNNIVNCKNKLINNSCGLFKTVSDVCKENFNNSNKKSITDDVIKPMTRKLARPTLISNSMVNLSNRNLNAYNRKLTQHQQQNVSLTNNSLQQQYQQQTLISIDFWENYDPAEVSRTGFGLIVSEPIAVRALCFLCGSSGLDTLTFCVCCCEPYHQYCIEDEYNLKQQSQSMDDTIGSFLDNSLSGIKTTNNSQEQTNTVMQTSVINRLNWLCPRCTVCYTCNMASGIKVKCQKCQKNYHSTCLGTSRRLLGTDRPLICANCLKCRSCGTTNVTKFVGNHPMCTACFKLRHKGNFCPLCQKCYEDNDFDLKMMECGECKRWVHAKCERLSDEQYNLLSVLPENIEFICKKCTKNNVTSDIWKDAVSSEFKSGLLTVVKLLSKSRQACALLKLSPRKKAPVCICQPIQSNRNIQFKKQQITNADAENNSPYLKLYDNLTYLESLSQYNEDLLDKTIVNSNDQQDVDDPMNSVNNYNDTNNTHRCYCRLNQNQNITTPSLLDVKRKINSSEYVSLQDFNYDMQQIINAVACEDLMTAYKEILSETFPWFQNETKACTDALEEDMFNSSCPFSLPNINNMDTTTEQQVPTIDLPEYIDDYFYSIYDKNDRRTCMFCKGLGEGMPGHEARLLYCGQNNWVHSNCALWSAEVFEEIDGSLQNIHSAITRGRMIKCSECGNKGATVGCNLKNCGEHYHYPCARRAGCAFTLDKIVYCPKHLYESEKNKSQLEKSFEVLRPVYIELDRRKKKFVEPSKVQFLIGSLAVKQLGRFIPFLSDCTEAIVPIDFQCTRLYWSSKEPWKIVEYTVKTSILNNNHSQSNDYGKNFTVDHTMNANLVQFGIAQINKWHNSLHNSDTDFDQMLRNQYYQEKQATVKQFLEAVNGGSCSNNSDDTNEEEPQNNADLLPPEIKEAIFEDLPHDILDGISMLDILPKLMTYEDLDSIDLKNEAFGDLLKENKDDLSDNDDVDDEDDDDNKNSDISDNWMTPAVLLHVEDALLSATRPICTSRELKRSKSEIFNRGVAANRNQRSSTWSCKMEANSIAAKRRKIVKSSGMTIFSDRAHILQDLKLSDSVLRSLGRVDSKYKKDDTVANNICERRRSLQNEDYKISKNLTWTATKKLVQIDNLNESLPDSTLSQRDVLEKLKISQLDGMDDISSGSESGSPMHEFTNNIQISNVYDPNIIENPVKCDRCHCTYRTHESYQRHLATCEPMSTSESESEVTPRSPDADIINGSVNCLTTTTTSNNNIFVTPVSMSSEMYNSTNTIHSLINPLQQHHNQIQQHHLQQQQQQQQTISLVPTLNGQNLNNLNTAFSIENGSITTMPNTISLNGATFTTANNTNVGQNGTITLNQGTLQAGGFPINQIGTNIPNMLLASATSHQQNINGNVIDQTGQAQQIFAPLGNFQSQIFPLQNLSQTTNLNQFAVNASDLANAQNAFVQNKTTRIIQQGGAVNSTIPQTITLPPGISLQNFGASQQQTIFNQQSQHISQPQIISIGPNGSQQIMTLTTQPNTGLTAIRPQHIQNQQTASPQKNQLILPQPPNTPSKRQTLSRVQQSPIVKTKGRPAQGNKPIQMKRIVSKVKENTINKTQPMQIFTTANLPINRPAVSNVVTTGGAQNVMFQQTPQNTPILVQQMGNTGTNSNGNLVSYMTSDGQNGMQYITLPTNDYKHSQPTQYLTPSQLVPGAFQLQTDSGNLMLTNGPGGLSVIPNGSVQLAQAPQQQIIGTIIQPQATTLQCGMMATEQMVLGSTPTLEMVTDPASGCMYLTSQPVYYGLETIVQNTVMSSQQFVSTAMQGVLSQNSSFSATTTQVFQASKIEPIMEVPTGYVVLNNVNENNVNVLSQQNIAQPNQNLNGNIIHHNATSVQQLQVSQAQPQQIQSSTQPIVTTSNGATWKFVEDKSQQQPQLQFQQQQQFQQPQQQQFQRQPIQQIQQLQKPQLTTVSPNKLNIKTSPIITKIQPQIFSSNANNTGVSLQTVNDHQKQHIILPKQVLKSDKELNPIVKSITLSNGKSDTNIIKSYNAGIVTPTTSTTPIQPIQKLTNIIKPIGSKNQASIKPKIIGKPVNNKTITNNGQIKNSNSVASVKTKIIMNQANNKTITATNDENIKKSVLNKIIANNELKGNKILHVPQHEPQQHQNQIIIISQQQQESNSIQENQQIINNNSNNQLNVQTIVNKCNNIINHNNNNNNNSNDNNSNNIIQTNDLMANHQQTQQPYLYQQTQQLQSTVNMPSTNSIQLPYAPTHVTTTTIPTNVVNPIQQLSNNINQQQQQQQLPQQQQLQQQQLHQQQQQQLQQQTTQYLSRPTNRVLPMQTIQQRTIDNNDKLLSDNRKLIINNIIDNNSNSNNNNNNSDNNSNFSNNNNNSNINNNNNSNSNINIINNNNNNSNKKINNVKSKNISDTNNDLLINNLKEKLFNDINHNNNNNNDINIENDSNDGILKNDDDITTQEETSNEIKDKISQILNNLEDDANNISSNNNNTNNNCNDNNSNNEELHKDNLLLEQPENTTMYKMQEDNNNNNRDINEQKENIEPITNNNNNNSIANNNNNINNSNNNINSINNSLSILQKLQEVQPNRLEQFFQHQQTKSINHHQEQIEKSTGPKILYEIQSQDGFTYKSTSITEIWDKVFEAVQMARKAHGLTQLPDGPLGEMNGYQMLGLKTNAIKYLLEQLPGTDRCNKYVPRYHKKINNTASTLQSRYSLNYDYDELKENIYGSARCEPFTQRSEYDMFSWLASRHRKQPSPVIVQMDSEAIIPRRGSSSNLPMAMRYRALKETSKESVGVYRSHIHGRGLFCTRDIEAGEMVIEYAGELIRSTLTDKREKYYDSKGIGCYMFRIDDNFVVDATMRGNAARFINHSCEPNCYSKVVDILGHKHIIIFALRRIIEGEELTYDYKFPFEDIKIPCSCGSKRCRKYLN